MPLLKLNSFSGKSVSMVFLPRSDSCFYHSKRCSSSPFYAIPLSGSFKLNFDGSKLQDGSAYCDFTICNWLGIIVIVGAISIHSNYSILVAREKVLERH